MGSPCARKFSHFYFPTNLPAMPRGIDRSILTNERPIDMILHEGQFNTNGILKPPRSTIAEVERLQFLFGCNKSIGNLR